MTTVFFLWTAVAIGATVFAGFWFTYFGPMLSGDRAPDAPAVHLHGWSFFAWYALLAAQAALAHALAAVGRTFGFLY